MPLLMKMMLNQFNGGIKFNGYKLLSEYYESKIDFYIEIKIKALMN